MPHPVALCQTSRLVCHVASSLAPPSVKRRQELPFLSIHSSALRRQRRADEFLIVAGKDMAVRVGGRGPDEPVGPKRRGGFEHMRAADLAVTLRREAPQDQVALVGEEEHGFARRRQMNARAGLEVRDCVCQPHLLAVMPTK